MRKYLGGLAALQALWNLCHQRERVHSIHYIQLFNCIYPANGIVASDALVSPSSQLSLFQDLVSHAQVSESISGQRALRVNQSHCCLDGTQ